MSFYINLSSLYIESWEVHGGEEELTKVNNNLSSFLCYYLTKIIISLYNNRVTIVAFCYIV